MEYVIGVDGGGTKTAFALADTRGKILAQAVLPSISYREHGLAAVAQRLRGGITQVLGGKSLGDVRRVAVGAPAFGENHEGDRLLTQAIREVLPETPFTLVNDAEIACWGALCGRPGINVVAGTGSIAFGVDAAGCSARSGGWSEQFSDEGSCYWLGRQAMGLFCKEADGREKKDALYEILFRELKLREDMDFIRVMELDYLPQRSRTAGLQRYLLEAARAGDVSARQLYVRAAEEICALAMGVRGQLHFEGVVPVSVTGGLLHSGTLVETPLRELLAEQNMVYVPCEGEPLQGAVLLACRG